MSVAGDEHDASKRAISVRYQKIVRFITDPFISIHRIAGSRPWSAQVYPSGVVNFEARPPPLGSVNSPKCLVNGELTGVAVGTINQKISHGTL